MMLNALFLVGAWTMWRHEGWSWVTITLVGMSAIGVGAIIETLLLRIRLTNDALVVRDLRGTRSYPKQEIEAIAEAKGVPPSLRLKDGRWVKLPSVGSNLGNSVRAWLKS
jgi:hypothetical protein